MSAFNCACRMTHMRPERIWQLRRVPVLLYPSRLVSGRVLCVLCTWDALCQHLRLSKNNPIRLHQLSEASRSWFFYGAQANNSTPSARTPSLTVTLTLRQSPLLHGVAYT